MGDKISSHEYKPKGSDKAGQDRAVSWAGQDKWPIFNEIFDGLTEGGRGRGGYAITYAKYTIRRIHKIRKIHNIHKRHNTQNTQCA